MKRNKKDIRKSARIISYNAQYNSYFKVIDDQKKTYMMEYREIWHGALGPLKKKLKEISVEILEKYSISRRNGIERSILEDKYGEETIKWMIDLVYWGDIWSRVKCFRASNKKVYIHDYFYPKKSQYNISDFCCLAYSYQYELPGIWIEYVPSISRCDENHYEYRKTRYRVRAKSDNVWIYFIQNRPNKRKGWGAFKSKSIIKKSMIEEQLEMIE